jgi:hypothetical protein
MIMAQRNLPLSDCEDGVPSGAAGLSTLGWRTGTGCQHGADTKVSKGKGDADMALAAVVDDMLRLVTETKAVAGRSCFLEVHRRKQTGQTSLRWRLVPGGWRHVKWEDECLQHVISHLPLAWRDWYAQADALARRLNKAEREARARLRDERSATMSSVRHVSR